VTWIIKLRMPGSAAKVCGPPLILVGKDFEKAGAWFVGSLDPAMFLQR
jgi:hypothetical protein